MLNVNSTKIYNLAMKILLNLPTTTSLPLLEVRLTFWSLYFQIFFFSYLFTTSS